jgi:hypothetical protein
MVKEGCAKDVIVNYFRQFKIPHDLAIEILEDLKEEVYAEDLVADFPSSHPVRLFASRMIGELLHKVILRTLDLAQTLKPLEWWVNFSTMNRCKP